MAGRIHEATNCVLAAHSPRDRCRLVPSQELLDQLERAFADRQLFLVGGSIRDELLARETSDLDFATDVPPEETRRRVEPWADSVWLVGEKFGTVGLQYGQMKAEITTFRTDTYDGVSRKPEVEFGDSIEEDLARRDFTINALARNVHTGALLDPFGGQDDLAARLVRFVGDAENRIREDPLRMLRAVRFATQLEFELDPTAAAAIASEANQLARISWERIRDELDAVLLSAHPADGLKLMIDLGLAQHILPELLRLHLPEPHRHHMRDLLEHTLDTVNRVPATKLLRYAALLHDVAKPETLTSDETGVHFYRHERIGAEQATAILSRLRQSGDLVEGVSRLVRGHMRIPYYRSEWTDGAVRRLMYDLGRFLEPALALAEADVRASDPVDLPGFEAQMTELRRRIADLGDASEIAQTRPLLNGDEVMVLLGIEAGPQVGEVLEALFEEQIEGRVTNRDEALAYVQERYEVRNPGS